MGNLITEAKEYVIHDIAPTLSPNIRGLFQAKLIGMHRNHAEIEIRVVNQAREVLKSFGAAVIPIGGAVIVDQFQSIIEIHGTKMVGYFQAWLVGMNKENTEAEIALRLVDENRKELITFGSVTRKKGGTLTLEGLEIVLQLNQRAN